MYLHKQKMVGEWPIMSLPVLIAQTECKSSANSLHLYELLFPLLPSKSGLTLCIAGLPSLRGYNTAPFIHLKNSGLDHRFKKIVASSVYCIDNNACTCASMVLFTDMLQHMQMLY